MRCRLQSELISFLATIGVTVPAAATAASGVDEEEGRSARERTLVTRVVKQSKFAAVG